MVRKWLKGLKAVLSAKDTWRYDITDEIPEYDIRESRVTAALSYVIFFIPLVFHDDLQFARFHCNQGLLNVLLSTLGATVLGIIPYVGLPLLIVTELFCLFNAIRGIILALRGKAVGIPLLGKIKILAYRRA